MNTCKHDAMSREVAKAGPSRALHARLWNSLVKIAALASDLDLSTLLWPQEKAKRRFPKLRHSGAKLSETARSAVLRTKGP